MKPHLLSLAMFSCWVITSSSVSGDRGDESSMETEYGYPFGNNLIYPAPIRIAITMPITSRSSGNQSSSLRLFHSFLPSFLSTARMERNSTDDFPSTFEFYLGYDHDDPVFHTPEGRDDFKSHFAAAVLGFDNQTFCGRDDIMKRSDKSRLKCVSLRLLAFNYSNTLTALWNGLNSAAFQVRAVEELRLKCAQQPTFF